MQSWNYQRCVEYVVEKRNLGVFCSSQFLVSQDHFYFVAGFKGVAKPKTAAVYPALDVDYRTSRLIVMINDQYERRPVKPTVVVPKVAYHTTDCINFHYPVDVERYSLTYRPILNDIVAQLRNSFHVLGMSKVHVMGDHLNLFVSDDNLEFIHTDSPIGDCLVTFSRIDKRDNVVTINTENFLKLKPTYMKHVFSDFWIPDKVAERGVASETIDLRVLKFYEQIVFSDRRTMSLLTFLMMVGVPAHKGCYFMDSPMIDKRKKTLVIVSTDNASFDFYNYDVYSVLLRDVFVPSTLNRIVHALGPVLLETFCTLGFSNVNMGGLVVSDRRAKSSSNFFFFERDKRYLIPGFVLLCFSSGTIHDTMSYVHHGFYHGYSVVSFPKTGHVIYSCSCAHMTLSHTHEFSVREDVFDSSIIGRVSPIQSILEELPCVYVDADVAGISLKYGGGKDFSSVFMSGDKPDYGLRFNIRGKNKISRACIARMLYLSQSMDISPRLLLYTTYRIPAVLRGRVIVWDVGLMKEKFKTVDQDGSTYYKGCYIDDSIGSFTKNLHLCIKA